MTFVQSQVSTSIESIVSNENQETQEALLAYEQVSIANKAEEEVEAR
jgi:hypothetical protein